jgi:Met-zincin
MNTACVYHHNHNMVILLTVSCLNQLSEALFTVLLLCLTSLVLCMHYYVYFMITIAFSSDEDNGRSDGVDPMVSIFDMSNEPLTYWNDKLQLVAEVRETLLDRSVQLGESFTNYANGELVLLNEVLMAAVYATKYIGGFHFTKQRRIDLKDSTTVPMTAIASDKQRQALQLIVQVLTQGDATSVITPSKTTGNTTTPATETASQLQFLPSAAQSQYMVQRGGYCEGLDQVCLAVEPFNSVKQVLALRKRVLQNILANERLDRISLMQWGASPVNGESTFTVMELFDTLTAAIWGDKMFSGDTVQFAEKWPLMLYYTDVLMAMSNDAATSATNTIAASKQIYSILGSIPQPFDDSKQPSWALAKEFQRRVLQWQQQHSH